jgi:hypothetical protein
LPNGGRASVEDRDSGKLMVVPVPPGMDGKAWSLDRLVQPYENFETLTVRQAFSLSPEVFMVPSDALMFMGRVCRLRNLCNFVGCKWWSN